MGIPTSNSSSNNWAQDQETGQTRASTSAANDDLVIDESRKTQLEQAHTYLRVLYIIAAILLGVAAALSFVGQKDVGLYFFAIYVFFFAILICCYELGFSFTARFIAVNFGFLYSLTGRMIFLLFVGFMSFALGQSTPPNDWGYAAMGVLYLVGLVHVYFLCKFPEYEAYVRRKHFYEGKK